MRPRLLAAPAVAALGLTALALGVQAGAAPTAAAPTAAARTPTLHVAIPGAFAGCDPGSPATTPATDAVLALVLPSAFTPGPTDAPQGDTYVVAEAEPHAVSPQTVVYTIAQGAKWPDGTPLRPSDLVRTWHERRGDRVLADLGYRAIASVRPTVTGTGVVVRFRAPYADWESLFNLIVPARTFASVCTLPSAALDPSIGPYAIASASATTVVLRANPAWPGAVPAYRHVVVTTDPAAPPPGPSSAAARITYLPSPTLAQLQAITSTGGYASRVQHDATVVSLDFALRGPDALVPAARRGLAWLVDRAALVGALAAPVDDTAAPAVSHLFGQGQAQYPGPTGSPVALAPPPSRPVPGATGAAAYGDLADPVLATSALRGAGYVETASGWRDGEGAPLTVCLAVPTGAPTLRETGEALASQLRAHGVAVDLAPEPTVRAVVTLLREGGCTAGVVSRTGDGFVSHAASCWLAPTPPLVADLTWTGVDDSAVAADAATASRVLDPQTAAPTWDTMDARLWDLMVGLPLFSPSVFVGWSPSVAGILPTDTLGGFVAQVPTLLPSSTKG